MIVNLLFYTCALFGLILIAVLVALLALVAPIRKLCLRSERARVATITLLGLLSLSVTFGLLTWLAAQTANYAVSYGGVQSLDIETEQDRLIAYVVDQQTITKELWARSLVPPPLRQACYTDVHHICETADAAVQRTAGLWDWRSYGTSLGLGVISTISSTILAWVFTRRRPRLVFSA